MNNNNNNNNNKQRMYLDLLSRVPSTLKQEIEKRCSTIL